jgi:chromosome segregation ATPase
MVERHISRKDGSAEDELSHIPEIGPKIDAIDPMAVVARTIVFGKELSNAPKETVIKEKAKQFKDQINNTNQYLKFINAHLAEKKSKIAQLRENERRFKEELESLQNNTIKSRDELDKVHYKHIKENDAKSLLTHLELERQSLHEKLQHQQELMEKAKQELSKKEEQIKSVQNELELFMDRKAVQTEDPIFMLKEELAKLGINNESARILDAVNSLAELLNSKKSRSH